MRWLPIENIHTEAVKIGRHSKNKMTKTANRLAVSDVDSQIKSIVKSLTEQAWLLEDKQIIEACARRLWVEFCMVEITLQERIKL